MLLNEGIYMNMLQINNKMKCILPLMIQAVMMLLLMQRMYATNGTMSGSGTTADPFQVADYADLKVVGTTTTYTLSAVYRLVADIDASPSATENSDSGFVPIGIEYLSFDGAFHGGGHVIKNLTINRPQTDFIGLFGYIDGTIDSVGMENGSVSGHFYTGELVGYMNSGTISYCYASGSVVGNLIAGGLVGYIHGGSVSYCYSTGSVVGNYFLSGIFGGLAGQNSGLVSNSYATGSISGNNVIGGLVGANYDTVINCYATGSVLGDSACGGLIGISQDSVFSCYAVGSVSGSGTYRRTLGENNSRVDTCYWNIETSAVPFGIGLNTALDSGFVTDTGLTSLKMKNPSSFSGWNFNSTWIIRTDSTYPGLRGIDNAPFAFPDSLRSNRIFALSQLLANDCDIETAQKDLVLKVISASIGTTDGITTLIFPSGIANGTVDVVKYRVGEIARQIHCGAIL